MKTLKEQEIFYELNEIVVRRSKMDDVVSLAPMLSNSDIHEAWVLNHSKPLEALVRCMNNSILAITVEKEGNIIAVGGIIPDEILGKKACVWFVATDGIKEIGRLFLLNARKIIDIFLSYYPCLYTHVHHLNMNSIAWMKFCSFKFEEAKPYGVENELFHYASIGEQER